MKNGHSVRFYKIRKFCVPNGVMKWVPKNPKASNDPIKANGPKFVRGTNPCYLILSLAGLLDGK